jgi:tetratricopeptide (TPR) repeat protein
LKDEKVEWVDVNEKTELLATLGGLLRSVLALIALAALCSCTLAQEMTSEDWCKKGLDLSKNGSYEEAFQAYDKAIQIDPQNADAWVSKGHISSFLDKTDDARRKYEIALGIINQTLEENPQDANAWIEKGVVLSCLGRDAEAINARENALEIYNGTLQKNPDDANAWETKALTLAGMGRWEEAIKAYDEVIELSPAKAPGAWMDKAMCYSEGLGMINESIDAWVMAAELIPINDIENRSTIWSGMAKSLSDAGRYEEALQAYEKAIELNPKDAHGWPNWSGKAYALYVLGRYNESIEACDTAIEMLPEHPDIWVLKGDSLYNLGRHEEALEAYDKALEFNPKEGAAWMGKGRIFYDNGRYEEAVEAYDKVIEFAPFNVTPVVDLYAMNLSATAWHDKGEALKALGRTSESEAAFARARDLGYES